MSLSILKKNQYFFLRYFILILRYMDNSIDKSMDDSIDITKIFYRTDEFVPSEDTETIISPKNNDVDVSESLFSETTPYKTLFGGSNDDNGFRECDAMLVRNIKNHESDIFEKPSHYYRIPVSMEDTYDIKNKLLDIQRDIVGNDYIPTASLKSEEYSLTSEMPSQKTQDGGSITHNPSSETGGSITTIKTTEKSEGTKLVFPPVSSTSTSAHLPINWSESTPTYVLKNK